MFIVFMVLSYLPTCLTGFKTPDVRTRGHGRVIARIRVYQPTHPIRQVGR
jgi:hypothetical protein